jgi:Ca2+-transporting ATPase
MPIHIVLLELMIDPISSITFEKIKEEKNTMLIPPRGAFVKFFNQPEWKKSIIEGLMLFGTTLLVFFISKFNHQHELQIRTNVFIAFVSGNLLLVINQLSRKESIIKSLYQISKPIIITNLIIVTILLLLIIVPYFRSLFKFGLPDFQDLGTILIALIFLALMLSILKRRKRIS